MLDKYCPQQIGDFLVKHFNKIESVRNHVLKEFYEERNEERDAFKSMINQYLERIKDLINSELCDKSRATKWPVILIDSIVEVQDLDYNELEKLKIVPPFYEDRVEKLDCASCLSPVGYALLFRQTGDKVTVETPLGNCNFMIKSISLPPV